MWVHEYYETHQCHWTFRTTSLRLAKMSVFAYIRSFTCTRTHRKSPKWAYFPTTHTMPDETLLSRRIQKHQRELREIATQLNLCLSLTAYWRMWLLLSREWKMSTDRLDSIWTSHLLWSRSCRVAQKRSRSVSSKRSTVLAWVSGGPLKRVIPYQFFT